MTTVGKILIFFNLVFSFVVGFFAVMDYTARTHWAARYTELSRKYEVEQATGKTYKTEADRLTRERATFNQQLAVFGRKELQLQDNKPEQLDQLAQKAVKLLRDRDEQIVRLTQDQKNLTDKLAKADRDIKGYEAGTTIAQEASKRHQSDVEKLRESYNAETSATTSSSMRRTNRRPGGGGGDPPKSLKDRNNSLEEQLQDLARDLARLRSSGGSRGTGGVGTARAVTRPPTMSRAWSRAEGNLVTISIGSDAGSGWRGDAGGVSLRHQSALHRSNPVGRGGRPLRRRPGPGLRRHRSAWRRWPGPPSWAGVERRALVGPKA